VHVNLELSQFRQAYWEHGISVDEYEDYVAVEYYRDICINNMEISNIT